MFFLPVEMRKTGTFAASGSWRLMDGSTSISIDLSKMRAKTTSAQSKTNSFNILIDGAFVVKNYYVFCANVDVNAQFVISAEL